MGLHLLADEFGGSRFFPNIVPGSEGLNAPGACRQLEKLWKKGIESGTSINISITLSYGRWTLRPSAFRFGIEVGEARVKFRLPNRADADIPERQLARLKRLLNL